MPRSIIILITLLTLTIATHQPALALPLNGCAPSDLITRITWGYDGSQPNSDSPQSIGASAMSLSHNGRYVAFQSSASNLVPDDTNNAQDVFVYDRQTCQIIRVSVSSSGIQANADSQTPSIDGTGRYIAFASSANNLTSGDTGHQDIFVHDIFTHQTRLVSKATNGTKGNADSYAPAIAAGGNYVSFSSLADNLVSGSGSQSNIYTHNLTTQQTTLISQGLSDAAATGNSSDSSISRDGRYTAFLSQANNLVTGDINNQPDYFIHDANTSQITRISVSSVGAELPLGAAGSKIVVSADGSRVAFESSAGDIVPEDPTDGTDDIFVRALSTGLVTRVSTNGATRGPSISADGRFVGYVSYATNIGDNTCGPHTTPGACPDFLVYDSQEQQISTLYVYPPLAFTNGEMLPQTALSGDGLIGGFYSADTTNFLALDSNGFYDAYLAFIPKPLIIEGSNAVQVVNTIDDINNGDCNASHCSLREAINEANAYSGPSTIRFNIPGALPHTIRPTSALPAIADTVVIRGSSEPDFNGSPVVELDGSLAGSSASGLTLTGGYSRVEGLVINRFQQHGIHIIGSQKNIVEGNIIGLNVAGTAALPNLGAGIYIENSANNRIGGTIPTARNILTGNYFGLEIAGSHSVSNIVQGNYVGTDITGTAAIGNSTAGVVVYQSSDNSIGGAAANTGNLISGNGTGTANTADGILIHEAGQGNIIQGNYVGTNATGTAALANTGDGIAVVASLNTLIGGTSPTTRNVISGNSQNGISISGVSSIPALYTVIQGNYIGTNANGSAPLANAVGIWLDLASYTTIGGILPGTGNIIAFNQDSGVALNAVTPGQNNAILGNRIFSTAADLGIDLATTPNTWGVTPNDLGDLDSGPNNLQNYLELTSFTYTEDGTVRMAGQMNGVPHTTYRIEFFGNAACDASGNGEGQHFWGYTFVTTDAIGLATFAPTFAVESLQPVLTATTTDPFNNTSEFSPCTTGTLQHVPTANAGTDQTLVLVMPATQAAVTLDGSASTDPDGEIVTYQWQLNNTPIPNGNGSQTTMQLPTGVYIFTLIVTDDQGLTATDTVTITVQYGIVPVAQAGSDRTFTIKLPAMELAVTLDGSASTDADGTIATYAWTRNGNPLATGAQPTVNLPYGVHEITLTVTDNHGLTHTDLVTITVLIAQPPTAAIMSPNRVVITPPATQASVVFDGSASTDPEGYPLSYEWRLGSTVIGTGAIITASLPAGTHIISLIVTDHQGLIAISEAVIRVDTAPLPPVANAGADQTLILIAPATQVAVTLDGSASTDADGTITSYAWTLNGSPLATGVQPTINLPVGTHEITLTVTDNQSLIDTDTVTITVALPLETPVLIAPANNTTTAEIYPVFTWSAVPDADSYELQIDVDDPSNAVIRAASLPYTPSAALFATTYHWRVRAINDEGRISPWSEVNILIILSEADAAPSLGMSTETNPVLSWQPLTWALQYQVQVDNQSNFATPYYDNDEITTASHTLTNLLGGVWYWRVRAQMPNGSWGPWSTVQTLVVSR